MLLQIIPEDLNLLKLGSLVLSRSYNLIIELLRFVSVPCFSQTCPKEKKRIFAIIHLTKRTK